MDGICHGANDEVFDGSDKPVLTGVDPDVSSNFYSLVQLHMNTKKYRRSRVASRKGHSPLELLTGKPWPEFIDLLEEYGFWDKDMAEQVA